MNFELWSFILENLDASGGIGGYVSISIVGFALISLITKQKLKEKLKSKYSKWTYSAIGSLLGAIPGCGATIVVASLYKNKKISFGGLFASFISTLGEGSFVLLGASSEAADIKSNVTAYITITLIGLVVGFFAGFICDYFDINPKYEQHHKINMHNNTIETKKINYMSVFFDKVGFYSIVLMSIFLAPGSIIALWGGSFDIISNLTYWVSIALSSTCIIYYLIKRYYYNNGDCFCKDDDLKSTLYHAIMDVALVVTYVFIGLFITNFVIDILVGAQTFNEWMSSSSYIILIAAFIGAIPGCGGMIAVAVAYITIPNFPLEALIAAAIATSGDGIFPLIAENKKDGLIISVSGFLIAIIIGYTAFIFS